MTIKEARKFFGISDSDAVYADGVNKILAHDEAVIRRGFPAPDVEVAKKSAEACRALLPVAV